MNSLLELIAEGRELTEALKQKPDYKHKDHLRAHELSTAARAATRAAIKNPSYKAHGVAYEAHRKAAHQFGALAKMGWKSHGSGFHDTRHSLRAEKMANWHSSRATKHHKLYLRHLRHQ